MKRFIRPSLLLLAVAHLSGCRDGDSPATDTPEIRSEPWLAPKPDGGAHGQTEFVNFTVLPMSSTSFSLRTTDPTVKGTLAVSGGQLTVPLLNLSQTQGYVNINLSSVKVTQANQVNAELSRQARLWLEVASGGQRTTIARLDVIRLEGLSVKAAHEGRRLKRLEGSNSTVRRVNATAVGSLTLHGFRVERLIPVSLEFHYAPSPEPSAPPRRIVVRTLRSFPVSLLAHDIAPRTHEGHVIAHQVSDLKQKIGSEARVKAHLFLVPQDTTRISHPGEL